MSYYLAPSLVLLRNEINKRWPKRSKASDGWIGDTSHQARPSDHNPDWKAPGSRRGVVRALDVTVKGIDVDLLLKHTTNDARVAYVIYNRRIYQHSTGWQPYYGSNPHTNHVHISIRHVASAETQQFLWFGSDPAVSGNVNVGSNTVTKDSAATTNSIVKYLDLKKRDSSFKARSALAVKHGIRNYTGTAAQNTLLLSKIRAADNKQSTSTPTKVSTDPNRYTVRSESEIRNLLLTRTEGTAKNTTPHLIGLYQRQQISPFKLVHDQIWGKGTDAHFRWVGQLQKHMNDWKGDKLEVDGNYMKLTHARVRDLQVRNEGGAYKGKVDGVAGPIFCKMLGISNYPN